MKERDMHSPSGGMKPQEKKNYMQSRGRRKKKQRRQNSERKRKLPRKTKQRK